MKIRKIVASSVPVTKESMNFVDLKQDEIEVDFTLNNEDYSVSFIKGVGTYSGNTPSDVNEITIKDLFELYLVQNSKWFDENETFDLSFTFVGLCLNSSESFSYESEVSNILNMLFSNYQLSYGDEIITD